MKIDTAEFIKSCSKKENFPNSHFSEFAFIGRSNSGKSSLINTIVQRKSLVKTGANPGVTRTVNFFLVNGKISIADLPGYGYAKVAKTTRERFPAMIHEYISSRPNLKTAFLLIDIRREAEEMEFNIIKKFTEAGVPYGIVLTKADKLKKSELLNKKRTAAEKFSIGIESVIISSSKDKTGRKELLQAISLLSRN